jgi:outer membrane protein assembly factor BamE (lipoprotein component of BamABCDE complex)
MLFTSPLALCALGLALWALWPHSAITEENIARIQEGMTRPEVEGILGGPARDESDGRRRAVYGVGAMFKNQNSVWWPDPDDGEWIGDEQAVRIYFDHGRVSRMQVCYPVPLEASLLSRLRRWLRF